MTSYHSVLHAIPPPVASELRTVRLSSGKLETVKVRAVLMQNSIYYLFSVYTLHNEQEPILQLISNPAEYSIVDALEAGQHKAAYKHTPAPFNNVKRKPKEVVNESE